MSGLGFLVIAALASQLLVKAYPTSLIAPSNYINYEEDPLFAMLRQKIERGEIDMESDFFMDKSRFQVHHDPEWPPEPLDIQPLGQISAVDTDLKGNPVIFHRAERSWSSHKDSSPAVVISDSLNIMSKHHHLLTSAKSTVHLVDLMAGALQIINDQKGGQIAYYNGVVPESSHERQAPATLAQLARGPSIRLLRPSGRGFISVPTNTRRPIPIHGTLRPEPTSSCVWPTIRPVPVTGSQSWSCAATSPSPAGPFPFMGPYGPNPLAAAYGPRFAPYPSPALRAGPVPPPHPQSSLFAAAAAASDLSARKFGVKDPKGPRPYYLVSRGGGVNDPFAFALLLSHSGGGHGCAQTTAPRESSTTTTTAIAPMKKPALFRPFKADSGA
ncbi:unnamed protein product [Notodromas monacha]|uniref:Uncharacterized protein n=1 Tax=Notodromas monacha TaxID=399045 RepID=A0A7R9BNL3_9CRUS|nr:unnamed protein product [Notodromas monacha]CAG0918792.1 unnamed protein product [Notodromas monacha]